MSFRSFTAPEPANHPFAPYPLSANVKDNPTRRSIISIDNNQSSGKCSPRLDSIYLDLRWECTFFNTGSRSPADPFGIGARQEVEKRIGSPLGIHKIDLIRGFFSVDICRQSHLTDAL